MQRSLSQRAMFIMSWAAFLDPTSAPPEFCVNSTQFSTGLQGFGPSRSREDFLVVPPGRFNGRRLGKRDWGNLFQAIEPGLPYCHCMGHGTCSYLWKQYPPGQMHALLRRILFSSGWRDGIRKNREFMRQFNFSIGILFR